MGFFSDLDFEIILLNLIMETLIVHPENKAQLNAIKQVLKAMKISFEKKEKPYNPEFVEKILQGDRDFAEGKYTKIDLDNLWK